MPDLVPSALPANDYEILKFEWPAWLFFFVFVYDNISAISLVFLHISGVCDALEVVRIDAELSEHLVLLLFALASHLSGSNPENLLYHNLL